jgi:hypothetical protein
VVYLPVLRVCVVVIGEGGGNLGDGGGISVSRGEVLGLSSHNGESGEESDLKLHKFASFSFNVLIGFENFK